MGEFSDTMRSVQAAKSRGATAADKNRERRERKARRSKKKKGKTSAGTGVTK